MEWEEAVAQRQAAREDGDILYVDNPALGLWMT